MLLPFFLTTDNSENTTHRSCTSPLSYLLARHYKALHQTIGHQRVATMGHGPPNKLLIQHLLFAGVCSFLSLSFRFPFPPAVMRKHSRLTQDRDEMHSGGAMKGNGAEQRTPRDTSSRVVVLSLPPGFASSHCPLTNLSAKP